MSTRTKEKIIQHLQSKGTYSPEIDDEVIDDLIDNMTMCKMSLKIVRDEDIMVSATNGIGFSTYKLNPAINAYQMFQRNVHQISAKLGINRKDRMMLKLVESKSDDGFDEISKT